MSQQQKFDSTFKATLTGIRQALFPAQSDRILTQNDRLEGKTCLITGANSGLGFAIAKQLADRGANLILAIRNGIPETAQILQQQTGNQNIEIEFVELADLGSIDAMIQRLKQKNIHIDILISNAGMVSAGSKKAANGLDLMFTVNYLAPVHLVQQLLQHQLIKPGHSTTPRLIFVSSESHRVDLPIRLDALGQAIDYSAAKVIKYYGYYKLLLNLFIATLDRKISQSGKAAAVFAICPGAVHSNIARQAPTLLKPFLWLTFKLFFQTPQKASRPAVYLACSPEVEGKSLIYLHMMQDKKMAEIAYDEATGEALWTASQQLIEQLRRH